MSIGERTAQEGTAECGTITFEAPIRGSVATTVPDHLAAAEERDRVPEALEEHRQSLLLVPPTYDDLLQVTTTEDLDWIARRAQRQRMDALRQAEQ